MPEKLAEKLEHWSIQYTRALPSLPDFLDQKWKKGDVVTRKRYLETVKKKIVELSKSFVRKVEK